jgi:hypothetical protein
MTRLAPLVLFVLALTGCPSKASHPPATGSDCPVVCQHLRDMACKTGDKTPEGVPCEDWLCSAHGVKLQCLARSTSCEQASQFQVDGCP